MITITTEPSPPASSDPGSHPTVTPRQRLTTENTDEEEDLRESGEQSHEEKQATNHTNYILDKDL